MKHGPLVGKAVELGAAVDALAALAAQVRIDAEGIPVDPRVRELLTEITVELVGGSSADPGPSAAPVVGLARTFLRQAAELIENPGRRGGWDQVDVPLLQSIGRLSMAVAEAVRVAEGALESLGERLAAPDARFLDVGSGTGWLAVAMARAPPRLRVVGIDIFEPALRLAGDNIAAEGLSDRIEFRRQDVATLADESEYDAVWLPMPFLPAEIVPRAMTAVLGALRPGGWLLAGTFTGPGGRLAELLTDLRTVRSGGHPWRVEELVRAIATAGFDDAAEVTRSWSAPVRLYAGRRR